ncbi:MAG TPA: DUF5010 C-terminal domain-containing protein [Verrucomicrobiota bacterium]|nr:DUF5010 C-terminal domain-containing protein [Verrucomicrobiota bacterium]
MMNLRDAAVAAAAFCGCIGTWAALPSGYAGKPFADAFHQSGVPTIPGIVQCAFHDLGGEGVACHDTDLLNNGSGKLNLDPRHQRAHAGEYIWHFRKDEGVDLSFVNDWADLNDTNLVSAHINQFYVSWTEDGEWCNYTVNVLQPGTYGIRAPYADQASSVTFDVNGKAAAKCRLPAATPGYHHWNFAAIGTFDAAGQPVQGLPAAGGWFEARVPSALLKADQPLMVKWVDFYRP